MPATLRIDEEERLATFPPMLILGSEANSTVTMQVVPALQNIYAGDWENALSFMPRWRPSSGIAAPAQHSVESPKLYGGTPYFGEPIKTALSEARIIFADEELQYSSSGIFVFEAPRRRVLKHFSLPVPKSGLRKREPHIVLSEIDEDE